MTQSPREFLAELYALDPDLRAHEEQLLPLLEKLIVSDPAQSPDPQFVATLRQQLSGKADTLRIAEEAPDQAEASRFRTLFAFLSGALTVAVLLPLAFFAFQKPIPSIPSATEQIAPQIPEGGAHNDIAPPSPTPPRSFIRAKPNQDTGPAPAAVPSLMMQKSATLGAESATSSGSTVSENTASGTNVMPAAH